MGRVPRGLPKSYIKKWGISKLAWKKFRAGALTKGIRTRTKAIKRRIKRARRTRRRNPGRKRGGRRMVRRYRRKRRRGGKSMTRTAFKLIRLGALAAPPIYEITSAMKRGEGIESGIAYAMADMTGYDIRDGSFNMGRLAKGWGPYLMACLTTYGIPKITSIIRRL